VTVSNDNLDLEPKTGLDGPALELDFPGLRVGVAEYDEGPTGCTVFLFDRGWTTAVDARGGLVGTSGDYDFNHGLCFAGGSLLGLEAATGVTAALFAQRGHSFQAFPLVSAAIIFDFGGRDNTVYPDHRLGRAATESAEAGRFPLGRRGAGRGATVGKLAPGFGESSGQGAAFRQVAEVRLLVCTVVNAVGAVLDRRGRVVRGNLDRKTGQRLSVADALALQPVSAGVLSPRPTENTTLTLVLTNARMERRLLTQLGRQVHASLARAIQPFHTITDGDVLYAVTSAAVDSSLRPEALGVAASDLAWDAVLAAVSQDDGLDSV